MPDHGVSLAAGFGPQAGALGFGAPAGLSASGCGPQATPGAGLAEPLTPREVDVLRLITAGATHRQIAEQLFISEETVKTHVVRVLRKLDVPHAGGHPRPGDGAVSLELVPK
jgi:LuxR family transcriptional regulator, maltose regulon positive regulatory protein